MGRSTPLIDLLTPREAAEMFGVTTTTLARWVRAGEISSVTTPGGHRRYQRADVHALLEKKGGR
jgi:excisionase family DNA binding protein